MPPEPKVTMSGFLDPAVATLAREAGISPEDISTRWVPEGFATGVECLSDLLFTELGTKLLGVIIGVGTTVPAIFGKGVDPRLRRELLTFGAHNLSRVADPTPTEMLAIAKNVASIAEGITKGDWGKVGAGFFRSPEEYKELGKALGIEQGGQRDQRARRGTQPATPAPSGDQDQVVTERIRYRVDTAEEEIIKRVYRG